jgi:hypothetical protein
LKFIPNFVCKDFNKINKGTTNKANKMNQEENIISYVRVRPVQDTEKILENVDEKSVIISRTSEKFSFGKILNSLLAFIFNEKEGKLCLQIPFAK